MNKVIIILFAIIFNLSCEQSNTKFVTNSLNQDTFVVDVSEKWGGRDFMLRNMWYIDSLMGLTNIQKGVSGLEIRIYLEYNRSDSTYVIVLRRDNDQWNATLIAGNQIWNKERDSVLSINILSKDIAPKSGWNVIGKYLSEKGILYLPDASKIPEYPFYLHGRGVTIAIATPEFYRICVYTEPNMAATKVREAIIVTELLKFLKEQFRIHDLQIF